MSTAYNILVVDDSSIVRAMVKKNIGMAGIQVKSIHEAGNGVEALKVLGTEWIDLVFADIHMPQMTGLELIRKMADDKSFKSIPVVVITSDPSDERLQELRSLGVREQISKPFRPEQFRDAVQRLLEHGGAQ